MRSALRRFLVSRHATLGILAFAALLLAPALGTGLTADDYFHKLVLTGVGDIPEAAIPRDPSQLFVWADGDARRAQAMMEVGMTGWWTDPALVMAYFRPLALITHWLDYTLWPDAPWLMHAHSIAWLLLACAGLAVLYGRVLGAQGIAAFVPALALALYAFDDARGMTVAWVANRNALVALACAVPVLVLHDHAARTRSRARLLGAALVLGLALLAGESALAITAYLFAYALFLDPAGVRGGLLRLAPHAAVAGAWAIAYRALGYGAKGSGLVTDPGGEPLRFLTKAVERIPVLLAAQVGFPPSDPWEAYRALTPWLPSAMYALAWLTLAVFARIAWPTLRAHPQARFFALGAVLAAVPVSAQFPHDRLLPFIGIGGMGLLALVLATWLEPAPITSSRTLRSRLRGLALGALAFLHLGLAPLWLPLRTRAPLDAERMIASAERSIDDSPSVRERTVVLMNPPVDAYAGYVPPMRAAQGTPRPRAVRWLATGASDTTFTRVDERSLRVRPAEGFLSLSSERMQRDPESSRIPVGYRVALSDLTIEVTALTPDGRPAEILARFAYPLEDARYLLLYWKDRRFQHFAPPQVGHSIELPRVDFTTLLP